MDPVLHGSATRRPDRQRRRQIFQGHTLMKPSLLLILVTVLPASPQWRHFGPAPVRPTGSFGIGFAVPVNPAATQLDAGWSLAGGFGLTNDYVGIMFDGMFTDFGINHDPLA